MQNYPQAESNSKKKFRDLTDTEIDILLRHWKKGNIYALARSGYTPNVIEACVKTYLMYSNYWGEDVSVYINGREYAKEELTKKRKKPRKEIVRTCHSLTIWKDRKAEMYGNKTIKCSAVGCNRTIDAADSDILYIDGLPVCPKCFEQFWNHLKAVRSEGENDNEQ